jgi:tetratricopeptide (TPR) repeat protein
MSAFDPSAAAPPSAQRRLAGLVPEVARLLDQAGWLLQRRDAAGAEAPLASARALAPDHPEVLRLSAVAAIQLRRVGDAIAWLDRALVACPDDPLLLTNLGSAMNARGEIAGAIAAFRRASEIAPNLAAAWYNLGKTLKLHGDSVGAHEALERALAIEPSHVAARVVHGDNLKALGRIEEATAAYRAALHEDPAAAHAWWGLANLKTVRFEAADADALAIQFRDNRGADRAAIGFALAKALEDQDRYPEALDVLHEVNALRRRQQPWSASAFSRGVDEIAAAFATMPESNGDAALGHEAIFIASLPRSGSTLAEQIIASHPDVEGAGEIDSLAAVLREESSRIGQPWPAWLADMSADDWLRLGERYLERTAQYRALRPRFTDKALSNGLHLGAAAAMLPGARFVYCRRDPVETALSCYRQWFNRGQAWSYSLDDIVAYGRDHERLMQLWAKRLPGRVFTFEHETLLAEPEGTVRALLDFLGLRFDARCLEFHRNDRSVRTASAAQVREPLSRHSSRAERYGALLDPLRRHCRRNHRRAPARFVNTEFSQCRQTSAVTRGACPSRP